MRTLAAGFKSPIECSANAFRDFLLSVATLKASDADETEFGQPFVADAGYACSREKVLSPLRFLIRCVCVCARVCVCLFAHQEVVDVLAHILYYLWEKIADLRASFSCATLD